MKQKYTLLIAGMEINVITEMDEDSVERIVSILDRKMREIIHSSKRCSKNEAALLCALDFCSDKTELKERVDELEDELEDERSNSQNLSDKLDMISKASERLEKENARLENENDKLRAIIECIKNGTPVNYDELNAATPEVEQEDAPAVEEKPAEEPVKAKIKSRNRVGSMFDLLTFNDV